MTQPARKTAAKKPQDHKVKDEAKRKDVTLAHEGIDYTITADAIDDLELFEMIEDGKQLTALRRFLGADQWETFKDSVRTDKGRVRMSDAEDFLNKLMDALGNLNASQPS